MNELFKKKKAFAKMAKERDREDVMPRVELSPQMKNERSMKQFIVLALSACGVMWALFYIAFRFF